MDEAEYKMLKRKAKEKHEATVKAADKQLEDDLTSLDKVWALAQEQQIVDSAKLTVNGESSGYGSLTKIVKFSIQRIKQRRFNKNDILAEMNQIAPKMAENCSISSLSGVLKRLERQGFVRCAKKGTGSAPHIYKKVED